jgi:hypothetical protein
MSAWALSAYQAPPSEETAMRYTIIAVRPSVQAAYDHRGVPQRLPPELMAAHDPRLQQTAQRRLLLMRVFLAAWWLPQRLAAAALLAACWSVELGTRWLLQRGPGPLGSRVRMLMRLGEEQLTPHDAVVEVR